MPGSQTSSAAGPDRRSGPPGASGAEPGSDPSRTSAGREIWPKLLKTLRHFFPNWIGWIQSLPDPRDPLRIVYPLRFALVSGMLIFLTKLGSRRQMRYQFKTEAFIHNVNQLCHTRCETMLDPDTLAYLLKRLPVEALESLRRTLLYQLLRQKCFQGDRLLGKYYRIAIDGSGHLIFRERHCRHCLTQKQGDETIYYHPVLEAKLVTPSGFALSIGTEFIENPQEFPDKQDCERKAFVRLAQKLKRDFPQLRICLLLDSLYVCEPVLDLCRQYAWRYIITFKEGSASAVFAEYERLKAAGAKAYSHSHQGAGQTFWWVKDLEFGKHRVHVLECSEVDPKQGPRRFVWMTDLSIEASNYAQVGNRGGRLRWKIENEGFNIQKNNGYEMEHAYCENEQAAKNFYLLLQIAHLVAQLVEKGLLAKSLRVLGALRNIARFLLEELRRIAYDGDYLNRYLNQRIQIRLGGDTS